jgi:metal-responsive CopG/Arc/MetJ family transcriptional regulator
MNDEIINLRIPKELHDKVWDIAGKQGKSVSSVIRKAIEAVVMEYENPSIVNIPVIGKFGIYSEKSGPAFRGCHGEK